MLLGIPVALAVVALEVGNTGKSTETPLVDKPARVYHQPKVHRVTPHERAQLFATMTKFVRTAVARKHLDDAWPMLGPDLRAGMTRKEWDTGFNTVVPYHAVGITAVDTLYSYDGDVAFDISLLGAKSEDAIAKTFTIELTRDPRQSRHWLVAAWVPRGVSSPTSSRAERRKPQPPAEIKAPQSAKWLLVPLLALPLALLVPIGLALRAFLAHRRAARRYAEELAAYRSSSSPS